MAATVAAAGIVHLPTAAIAVAVPTIHHELGASIAELQWTVTAFHIPFTALLIASGRLADIFGRRLLFVLGTLLFAGGSLVAAIAGDAAILIIGIAISGIGGAMIMPASMGILTLSGLGSTATARRSRARPRLPGPAPEPGRSPARATRRGAPGFRRPPARA